MKSNLQFDFTVDKTKNTVFVNREFDADQHIVWDAFTKQEILDQWWAPQPWTSKTKFMNFEEGGRRFYAMVSPEGQEHWAIQDFTSISPKDNFKFKDAFADKDENINEEMPTSEWNLDFSETAGITTVKISIKHKDLSDLEQSIKMGFKQGFTMTLDYLNELLSKISNQTNNKSSEKITVKTSVYADTKKVWNCWTKPEHITKWNFASDDWHCPKAENDLKVGGKYSSRMEAKDGSMGFDFEAVYDEIVDQKKITYTMSDGRKATTEFENNGDQTKVTTTFDAENSNPIEMQKDGWQAIINNFKKYVERN